MTRPSTEQLIHELAHDAPPVRPIPRLRAVILGVVAAWVVAVVLMLGFGSTNLDFIGSIPWSDPKFALVLIGLGAIAGGATPAALSRAVPGRENVARSGGVAALLGGALAVGGGLWAIAATAQPGSDDLVTSAACLSHTAALALIPMLVASLFLARGLVRRPLLASWLAATGTVALGGLMIHASCRIGSALHMLLGHALAPLILGFLLAIPISLLVQIWRQRR